MCCCRLGAAAASILSQNLERQGFFQRGTFKETENEKDNERYDIPRPKERESKKDRERESEKDRERERMRKIEREREKRQIQSKRDSQKERERERGREIQRERGRERQRERGRERETDLIIKITGNAVMHNL